MMEYWHLTTFGSDVALGNPTGVVFPERPLADADYADIAGALGNPDTIFLWPARDADEWETRTFSPAEEVAFCVQAMIAAGRVLRMKYPALGDSDIYLRAPARRAVVGKMAGTSPDAGWVKLPYKEIKFMGERAQLSTFFEQEFAGDYPELVVDAGRRRVYRRLPDAGALQSVSLTPEAVMDYCRSEGVNGVCLFALTGASEMALRVFTTSLDGREDASTGGAVSGLLTYLERQEEALDARRVSWTIQQGSGPARKRGTLFLRYVEPDLVAVGGMTRLVARGQLAGVARQGTGA